MRRTEDWQRRVLSYASVIPEVAHAGRFVENTTGKATLRVTGDDRVAPAIEMMLSSFPMGRVCLNNFYVGDVIVAFDIQNFRWQSFGKADYKQEGKKPLEVRGPDGKFRELDASWRWFRIYREDPSDQYAAWSTHKAMLDLMEAWYVHQLADTAVATSRLAGAGILYMPNDEFVDIPVHDGGEPEPGSQAHFEQRLRGAMTDSLKNRGTSDAFVPLIMFGSSEYADGIRHILMERSDDAKGFGERMDSYRARYGGGVEIPAEVVTGMGDANHWAAWKVDQNTWQYYLLPLVQVAVDALIKNFVTPVAAELGSTANVSVEVDATAVIVKPDRTDAAIRLYTVGALRAEAALEAAGFDAIDKGPNADDPKNGGQSQPDGQVRMPSAGFRDSQGEPVGARNFQR